MTTAAPPQNLFPDNATPGLAQGNLTPGLCAALVKLQATPLDVKKGGLYDQGNTRYTYPTTDDMVECVRTRLAECKLALVPCRMTVDTFMMQTLDPDTGKPDMQRTAFLNKRAYLLVAEDGGWARVDVAWPAVPRKGMGPEKVVAASDSSALTYLLRALGLVGRCELDEQDKEEKVSEKLDRFVGAVEAALQGKDGKAPKDDVLKAAGRIADLVRPVAAVTSETVSNGGQFTLVPKADTPDTTTPTAPSAVHTSPVEQEKVVAMGAWLLSGVLPKDTVTALSMGATPGKQDVPLGTFLPPDLGADDLEGLGWTMSPTAKELAAVEATDHMDREMQNDLLESVKAGAGKDAGLRAWQAVGGGKRGTLMTGYQARLFVHAVLVNWKAQQETGKVPATAGA